MKLLQILNKPFIKGIIKSIPVVGSLGANVLEETANTKPGQLDVKEMGYSLVRLGILVALLYLVFSGKLSMEEAEGYKEFIN